MLRALFFDLDGTLCRSTEQFEAVFADCLAPLAAWLPELSRRDLLARWAKALLVPGPSTTAGCLTRLLAQVGDDRAAQTLAEVADDLNARWAAAQRLIPGAAATLGALADCYPLGLITNGPSDAQRAVVEALGIAPFFRWLLVSGDPDIGVRKPDAGIFRRALQLAGCSPGAALYVGDSPANDVAGAASAGLRTCWLNPSGQPPPPGVPWPDWQLAALGELPAVLPERPNRSVSGANAPRAIGPASDVWRAEGAT